MSTKLLLATKNMGKIREFASFFADLDIHWVGLQEMGITMEVVEDGTSFEENAIIKASEYAEAAGCLTLADDSGLEVDALDGCPGVKTARFGGFGLTSEQRYGYLLSLMSDVPTSHRSARFRCVLALANPKEIVKTVHGQCEGQIAKIPKGDGGFGYDPIFYLPELGKTMAELVPEEKQKISHRAKAMAKIRSLLTHAVDQ